MANDFDYKFGLDFGAAEKALKKIGDKLESTLQKAGNAKIDVDTSGAERKIGAVESAMRKITSVKSTLEVNTDRARAKFDEYYEQAKDQLESLKDKASDFGDSLSGSIPGAGALSGVMQGFTQGGPIGAGIAAGAAAVQLLTDSIGAAIDAGLEYNSALGDLEAKSGKTGDGLLKLKAAAEDAFRLGVGESVADAVKVIGEADKLLGDSFQGEELAKFTARAQAVGNLFDKDVNEVLRSSGPIIKGFGLDGEQAFNVISLAAQGAKTGQDDVLDSLNEYAPVAKRAGLSALEFAEALTRADGAFNTDKIGDSIKEAEIRLKAGDITNAFTEIQAKIPQALSKTIGGTIKLAETGQVSLKDLLTRSGSAIEEAFQAGDITEQMRSQLQVAIAGTPAEDLGSDMYSRIFAAPFDEKAIAEKARKAGESVSKGVGQYTSFEQIGRELQLQTAKAGQKLIQFSDKYIAPVIGKLFDIIKRGAPLFESLGNYVGKLFRVLGTVMAIPYKISFALYGALAKIFGLSKGEGTDALDLLEKGFGALAKMIDNVVAGIEGTIQTLDAVTDTITNFIDKVSDGEVGGAFGGLVDDAKKVGTAFKDGAQKSLKETAKEAENLDNNIEGATDSAGNLTGELRDGKNQIQGQVQNAASLAEAFGKVQEAANAAVANNVGAASQMLSEIEKTKAALKTAPAEQRAALQQQLDGQIADLAKYRTEASSQQKTAQKLADTQAHEAYKADGRAQAQAAAERAAKTLEIEKQKKLDEIALSAKTERQKQIDALAIEQEYEKKSLQAALRGLVGSAPDILNARNLVQKDLTALDGKYRTQQEALRREFLKEDLQIFVDAEAEKTAAALTAEQKRIETTQAIFEKYGGGVEELRQVGEERIALQKAQGEAEALAIIEGSEKYKKQYEAIFKRVGDGLIDLDAAKSEIAALRTTLAQEFSATSGNDPVAALFQRTVEAQNGAILTAREELNLQLQRRELDFIEDTAQRELKIQLFELGVQHRERMKAVKGNRAMELRETREFESEKLRISTEAVLKTSKAYTAALAFVENFRNNLENAADTAAIDRANKDLDGLKDEEKALEESYKNREISHRDYTAKLLAISQARADKEREIEDAQFSFKKALQGASLAAFKKIEEERLQKVLDISKRIADDLQMQIEANADKLSISTENLEQLGYESLAVFAAQTGQLMAQNEAFLDSMAIAAVSTLNKIVTAAIFQNLPLIFATAISYLGPIAGPIAAAGSIALVMGLLSAAEAKTKAALSGPNKFADGVVNLRGPGTERSDSIPAWLSKGESVMRAEITRRELPLLEHLHDGGTSDEFFINKHGRLIRNIVFKEVNRNVSLLLKPKSRVPNAEVTAGFDRHTAVLKSELRGIKSEIKSLKNTTFQRAEHTIKVKSNPKEMLGATIEAQYKALNY